MPLSPNRWRTISESEFPWEREALDYLREALPDQEPFRARRAGTDWGRGRLVTGIRTRASAWTMGDAMPSHDRGASGKNT